MCPHIYVSPYLCVPVHVCSPTYMSPYLCVPVPVCSRTYVSTYRCVPVPMCSRTYVSPYRCVPDGKTDVSPYLCVPVPICAPFRVRGRSRLELGFLFYHLSLNRGGRWGITDDSTTSFLQISLFSTALWDLANPRPVRVRAGLRLLLGLGLS